MSIAMWMVLIGGGVAGVGLEVHRERYGVRGVARSLMVMGALLIVVGMGIRFVPKPDKTLTLHLPANTPSTTVRLLESALPAVAHNLPGLIKYQDSMSFAGLDCSVPYWSSPGSGLPEDATVTWLKFVVAENGGSIPRAYRAWGQHIRLGIVAAGATHAIILQKTQAKSILLDRVCQYTGEDLIIPY